ncbi:metal-dependent hydrolase [Paenibacillus elgii]|uniref:metal-dependent hydrolase n=1 Tax=Paenibacillus elgii TaxID=189691 RepID=UPI0013D5D76E|nr:metal-dependent hydrolase [Paenibacillus elgii]
MNKTGHVALAMGLGSVFLSRYLMPSTLSDLMPAAITMVGIAAGSLAPDIDHKTSTASKLITPFSAGMRKGLRRWGMLLQLLGILCIIFEWITPWIPPSISGTTWYAWALESIFPAGLLVWGAGLLLVLLARLRDLILLGVGAWLIGAYALYHLHWFLAFVGVALMILPVVKHRGIIHTPEFAFVFSIGALSLTAGGLWYVSAAITGFVIGWWLHLAGDIFGEEGIHSLLVPKLRVALRLFRNGGAAERWITRISWGIAIVCWLFILDHLRAGILLAA